MAAVHFASKPLEGTKGYWGRFRDVFDPNFGTQLRASMADQAAASADDPWCIGYFIDNELIWGTDISLALATLDSPAYQAAKQVFVSDLMAKYRLIDKLNAVWGMHYKSWGDLIESRDMPDKTRAHDDLVAFYRHTVREYFKLCRQAVRETAPNHLYLGCRFAGVNPDVVEIAAHYCDVLSYNIYRRSVADFRLPAGVDAPVIIGEFHFGATDRGQFSPGLVRVKDQAERAAAYEGFVSDALRHPNFVGCHWFSYRDEPTTGRTLDGENYQNGFVDVADTPYTETINAARDIGYKMYDIRAGAGAAARRRAAHRQAVTRARPSASEPMGSQGGKTMGGNLSAFCRGLGSALLRVAISNMYSSNHESFITKNPLRPHFSSPQLFSTRQRRGRRLTTSTPVNNMACVMAVW